MPKIFNRIFNVKWHWFTGFVPLFEQKKFKDFSRTFKGTFLIAQGLHSVRKTALSLCLFYFFHNMSNLPRMSFCVCSFLFGVLLSQHWNSRSSQHQLQFSRTLKALNIYFKIQRLSRCERTLRFICIPEIRLRDIINVVICWRPQSNGD